MALFLDPALTKGLQANWALPLFEPPPTSDRISDYLDGAGYFGIQEFDRTIGVDVAHPFPDIQAKEHQFIVDLTLAPDQPTKDYYKEHHTKARAMYTGYLHLWGKTTLDMIGWDTAAIFGAIPDDDIFAFVLTDFFGRFTALGYPTYFPHDVPAIYRAFYVNVDLDNTILTDLISNSMPRKLAEKLIAGYNIGTGNWVDDYLTLFLDHEEPIPVTGNSIIAPLRLHNPAVADQYRLSMFFLDSDFNDVSPELSNCFEYFQRLPHYNEDPVSHLPQMRSIAGHPLIHHATISNLPIEGARVDLLDHTDFTGKLGIGVTSNVAVDWETHPAGLVMQNPPVTPLSGPAAEDIDLTGHGESKFTVYNPDNVNVLVEFDSSGGVDLSGLSLNLVLPGNMPVLGGTSHIVPGDPEFDIVVVRTQAKSTQSQIYINVYQLDATLQNPIFVKRIALQFFDFKVFPVSFWRVNDTTLNLAYDGHGDLAAVIAEMNRALGKQANIFVYATARLNGPTDPVLEVADATEFFHAGTYLGSYPNFETYGSAAQIFNQAIDSQGTHEANVIWVPRLPNLDAQNPGGRPINPAGYTSPADTETHTFVNLDHPVVLIETHVNWQGALTPGDLHTAVTSARIAVHELGHYFAGRFNSQDETIDIGHQFPGKGEDEYFGNVFFATPKATTFGQDITVNQARFLNNNADSIQ